MDDEATGEEEMRNWIALSHGRYDVRVSNLTPDGLSAPGNTDCDAGDDRESQPPSAFSARPSPDEDRTGVHARLPECME